MPAKTGPDDAKCVIWVVGEFFLSKFQFFSFILTFYCIPRLLYTAYMTGRVVTVKTGPNDVGHVVWALGEFFFIFFFFSN